MSNLTFGNLNNAFHGDLYSLIPLISEWKTNTTLPEIVFNHGSSLYENQEFVVFDTETMGFKDEIIEIGAIIVKNNLVKHKDGSFHPYEYYIENNKEHFNEMDSFAYFILPTKDEIPENIVELTHITMDIIKAGLEPDAPYGSQTYPNFVDAFTDFIKYIGGRPIIAHNSSFDTGIFKWSVNNFFFDINEAIHNPNHDLSLDLLQEFFTLSVIDTYGNASRLFTLNPNSSHQNGVLSEFYGLKPNNQMLHRAIYDVMFTARNFYGLYETWSNVYSRLEM